MSRYFTALALILLFAVAPFIPVVIAGTVASANGCRLDEAGAYPCVIFGHDFGGLLAAMGVLGWAGLLTIPIGACLLCVWCAVLLFHLVRRKGQSPSQESTGE
ncbi:hypothetical protein FAZ69_27980 [Trinickia terrae]|uniref:Uncharacterized protein n=1 Tax=Trinickia terrae TaxID=2571161 RepID=A0A4U1HMT5_9BURK|nr:hypothetical protein FAZ69_27980 [Trinickia terrae]